MQFCYEVSQNYLLKSDGITIFAANIVDNQVKTSMEPYKIDQEEILRRRDMRDVFTFTIDPADAKDFDDALSYRVQDDGTLQIGVHIADVSHYVRPGSELDREAYEKATSTYLVDRVLPMLPEELCNGLCSLRPHEEKLCMSVIFTMNEDAKVLKYKICRTVICSDFRLNYDEAEDIIEGKPTQYTAPLTDIVLRLNSIAKILRQRRFAEGSLYLEQESLYFKLDNEGQPVEICFDKPNDAHHLIEEFMLLANRTVASSVGNKPFVYRVHDKPDEQKMSELRKFKKRMGDRVQPQVIDLLTVRAMAKAVYSTDNIGHYGLAFSHYTHFTSPIRRYPDMMVHRLVDKYLLKGKGESLTKEELEDRCRHCSDMEVQAQLAERDSIKQYLAIWAQKLIGQDLPGHICSVTDFGIFVQLDESHCEGLIHIHKLRKGDYMQYDEKNYRIIAAHSGETFTLGDAVTVRVIRADVEKRQVDFLLTDEVERLAKLNANKVAMQEARKAERAAKNATRKAKKSATKGKRHRKFA